jgi:hypothetical protein
VIRPPEETSEPLNSYLAVRLHLRHLRNLCSNPFREGAGGGDADADDGWLCSAATDRLMLKGAPPRRTRLSDVMTREMKRILAAAVMVGAGVFLVKCLPHESFGAGHDVPEFRGVHLGWILIAGGTLGLLGVNAVFRGRDGVRDDPQEEKDRFLFRLPEEGGTRSRRSERCCPAGHSGARRGPERGCAFQKRAYLPMSIPGQQPPVGGTSPVARRLIVAGVALFVFLSLSPVGSRALSALGRPSRDDAELARRLFMLGGTWRGSVDVLHVRHDGWQDDLSWYALRVRPAEVRQYEAALRAWCGTGDGKWRIMPNHQYHLLFPERDRPSWWPSPGTKDLVVVDVQYGEGEGKAVAGRWYALSPSTGSIYIHTWSR